MFGFNKKKKTSGSNDGRHGLDSGSIKKMIISLFGHGISGRKEDFIAGIGKCQTELGNAFPYLDSESGPIFHKTATELSRIMKETEQDPDFIRKTDAALMERYYLPMIQRCANGYGDAFDGKAAVRDREKRKQDVLVWMYAVNEALSAVPDGNLGRRSYDMAPEISAVAAVMESKKELSNVFETGINDMENVRTSIAEDRGIPHLDELHRLTFKMMKEESQQKKSWAGKTVNSEAEYNDLRDDDEGNYFNSDYVGTNDRDMDSNGRFDRDESEEEKDFKGEEGPEL